MLERYFVRPDTVDRIQSSWIGGAIDQYVTWLSEQNYSRRSVSRRVPLLVKFGDHARAPIVHIGYTFDGLALEPVSET